MSNMFYTLSTCLAQETGKDEILCRGVMRMVIMSSVDHLRQVTNPNEVMDYATNMAYQDWKAIIEGPAFSNILRKVGMKDTSTLTAQLMQTLVEQQSLFTMGAH